MNYVLHSGGHSFQPWPVRRPVVTNGGFRTHLHERLVTPSGVELVQCSRCYAIIPDWAWREGMWLLFSPATCRGDLHNGRRGTRTLTASTGPGVTDLTEPAGQLTLDALAVSP